MSELSPARAEMAAQVRVLGRSLVIPPPADDTVDVVMARLAHEPAPAGSSWKRLFATISDTGRRLLARWRLATAVLVAVLVAFFVASPAGAGIREWLGFGAVVVVQDEAPDTAADPSAGPSVPAGLPAGTTEVSLSQARSMVTFGVGVPARWATRIGSGCPTINGWSSCSGRTWGRPGVWRRHWSSWIRSPARRIRTTSRRSSMTCNSPR